MARKRKQIISGQVYEVEIRTRKGLPFPCWFLIRLLLGSAMARAQRDNKITIVHFLWMSNHLHLILIAKDAQQCVNFYGEVQKRLTDCIKRLLGLRELSLWYPGRVVPSQILDIDKAIDRIVYVYSNPTRANLVDHISQYPGFSSWNSFSKNPSLNNHSESFPWIRLPSIPKLPSRQISQFKDLSLTRQLKDLNDKESHELIINPNAIFHAFDITDPQDIASYNQSIIERVADNEQSFIQERLKKRLNVLGEDALRREPIFKPHTPKDKPGYKSFLFHTSRSDLAILFLDQYNDFCRLCELAYQDSLACRTANWPPGAFKPPSRPSANAL